MLQVVDVDTTPNPHALKFILNKKLLRFTSRQFAGKEEAVNDPLAKLIFDLSGVVSVFYMDRFITIEKSKDAQWGQIQRPLVNLLVNFDENTIPAEEEFQTDNAGDNELLAKINQVLDSKIRPALAYDGGGLEIVGFEGRTLKVKYQGACGSCPSSISGTLNAIESLLKRDVDTHIEVIAS